MYAPARTKAIIALFLVLATVAACGDDGTGPAPVLPDSLGAAADAADALAQPAQALVVPTVSLDSAFASLTRQGLVFDAAPSRLAARAWSLAGLADFPVARVEFPSQMLGQTFILDPDQQAWVVDPSRSGAPPDGVRIVWYGVDAGGAIALPLVERGYIDLTDEDTQTLSQLGVRIVITGGSGDQVLAQFNHGYWTQGDVEWSEHFEADGFYSDGQAVVDFDLTSDGSGSDATGDQTFSFDIGLTGSSSSYSMSITGSDDGATGTTEEGFLVTVVRQGITTQLSLDFTIPAGGSQTGTGSIRHQGTRVADIVVGGSNFQYTPPGGGDFTSSQKSLLDIVVQTLLLDGLAVFVTLPLLYL